MEFLHAKVPTRKEIESRKRFTPLEMINRIRQEIPQGWDTLVNDIRKELLSLSRSKYMKLSSDTLREEFINGKILSNGNFLPGIEFDKITPAQQQYILVTL